MSNFELTEFINKPPKDVFAVLADPSKGSQFLENIKESKKITGGPIGVGTRFTETRLVNGKEAKAELLVTSYEAPKKFSISTEAEGIKVEYHYLLSPESNGTRVTWVCELAASGLRKMMLPMVAGIMKKEDGDHLQKLKAYLEAN